MSQKFLQNIWCDPFSDFILSIFSGIYFTLLQSTVRASQEAWVRFPGLGSSPGGGNGIFAWRIPIDRGAWWVTVCGVAELGTTEQLSAAHSLWLLSFFFFSFLNFFYCKVISLQLIKINGKKKRSGYFLNVPLTFYISCFPL